MNIKSITRRLVDDRALRDLPLQSLFAWALDPAQSGDAGFVTNATRKHERACAAFQEALEIYARHGQCCNPSLGHEAFVAYSWRDLVTFEVRPELIY